MFNIVLKVRNVAFNIVLEVRYVSLSDLHIVYLKNNIEHKKIKMQLELTTSSLSVVVIALEVCHKFHNDDTGNVRYNDKTAILPLLRT